MGPSPNRWRGSSTRPEPRQAAHQQDICVQMAGLCGMIQECFIQTLPWCLLWAQTLHGTASSEPLLWSPAHSKLWHGWVIRCVLILQGLFALSPVHRDVFHKQSPLDPIPLFNAHPSKYACRNLGVSMALVSPDKWNGSSVLRGSQLATS